MLIRHETLAFQSLAEIQAVQGELLRAHALYAGEHSPYYRKLFQERGLNAGNITLENLAHWPATGKDELTRGHELFQAVANEKIVDIVQSSGTTGLPTRVAYTQQDLDRLAYNEKLAFAATGITRQDTVLLTCTMDRCFIAGLAYFLGLRELGAATIRNGHGTLAAHRDILKRMQPTAMVGVPSFLRKLGRDLLEHGMDPQQTKVRRMICIGEPVRDRKGDLLPVGEELCRLWNARVFSTYASSETITAHCECEGGWGGHAAPDLAITEIVDEAGNPVPEGEVGEVVVTPLQVEGMPLLRYRTGDMSFLSGGPCRCGRNTPRLGPILGRKRQMIKCKGTTFYPEVIGLALEEMGREMEYYVEVSAQGTLSDRVVVHVAGGPGAEEAEMIRECLNARLRVTPEIVVESEKEIRQWVYSPEYRKPRRFVDRRNA